MTRPTCCSGDCDQGRACPHRAAVPPTRREWMFAFGMLVVSLVLSTLGGCAQESWWDADENYVCSNEQMAKVEHETTFCRDEVKLNAAACYGGAIMRNCQPRDAK